MAYTKAGIRFSNDSYVTVDAENPSIIGGFAIDMKNYPSKMTAGETYQLPVTIPEGGKMTYISSASNSKISISDDGLFTCIGNTTGFCGITIKGETIDGVEIFSISKRIEVV